MLIIGGPATAELWNPETLTFSDAGTLATACWWPTATLVDDGRVAVIGGFEGEAFAFGTPGVGAIETWDPLSQAFAPAGALLQKRGLHTATLDGGRILVVGGMDVDDGGWGCSRQPSGGTRLPRLLTAEMFLGQSYLTDCSAIVVITSVVQRSLWKYEDRGYRYILLEAGHVAQNLNLCAAAMDLASLNLGGFFDRDILGLLRADPDTEIALYGIALGHPQPVDRAQARRPVGEDVTFRRY